MTKARQQIAIVPRGLRRACAASYVGVSPGKFDDMIERGTMPQPREDGGVLVWDRIELDEAFTLLPHKGESESKTIENPWDNAA